MVHYAFYPFQFGLLKIGYEDDYVLELQRVDYEDEINEPVKLTNKVHKQVEEYLNKKRKKLDFPYRIEGTSFQKKVWEALLQIPYGKTVSYSEIADAIGSPQAARAIGSANRRNPLIILIPCHRVIGSNGSLTGYSGGLEMKQALLKLEQGK